MVTAYLLMLASLLVVGGSLGDRFGRRRIFLIGVVSFAASSAACAAAPNAGVLIAMRAVQGAGAALLVPASLAIVEAVFVDEDRGHAPRVRGAWRGALPSPDRARGRRRLLPVQRRAVPLPVTFLMLVLSGPSGRLSSRIGPRLQMAVGPVVVGAGLALLARTATGASYPSVVLPALLVFGVGLGVTVAPDRNVRRP